MYLNGNLRMVFVALVFVSFWASSEESASLCTLSGRVIDFRSGDPIGGVRVYVGKSETVEKGDPELLLPYVDPEEACARLSAEDGSFEINGISSGRRFLLIQDAVKAMVGEELPIDLKPGERREDCLIQVIDGAKISGTIFNEGYHHGVEGVVVEAIWQKESGSAIQRAYRTKTTGDGGFSLGGLPQGRYRIASPDDDGYQQTSTTFLGEETTGWMRDSFFLNWDQAYGPIEFTVKKAVPLVGRVCDTKGNPVAGARVASYYDGSGVPVLYSDAEGRFSFGDREFEWIPYLMAEKGDLISAIHQSGESVEEHGPVLLTLNPPAGLRGRVVNKTGTPFSDEQCFFIKMNSFNGGGHRSVKSDNTGRFEVARLPQGNYEFEVVPCSSRKSDYTNESILLGWGESREITLRYTHPLPQEIRITVRGRVVDESGKPISGALIETDQVEPARVQSDEQGAFEIEAFLIADSLLATEYMELSRLRFVIAAEGYLPRILGYDQLESEAEITLKRGARLEAFIVAEDTGKAVEHFSYQLGVDEREYTTSLLFDCLEVTRESSSRPAGKLIESALAPYAYRLIIEAPGYLPEEHCFSIDAGDEIYRVALALKRKYALIGKVLDHRGYPLGAASLSCRQYKGEEEIRSHAVSDAFGRFELTEITKAPVRISTYVKFYPQHIEYLRPGVDGFGETRIILDEGGTISGRITIDGKPLPDAQVNISEFGQPKSCEKAVTNAVGEYLLKGVPLEANRLSIEASCPSGRQRYLTLDFALDTEKKAVVNTDFTALTASLQGSLSGKLGDHNHLWIAAKLPNGEEFFEHLVLERRGPYTVRALPPGAALLRMDYRYFDDRPPLFHAKSVSLKAGQEVSVDFNGDDGVEVSGRLLGLEPDQDLSYTLVAGKKTREMLPDDCNHFFSLHTLGGDRPGKRGEFKFKKLLPGWVTLVVRKRNTELGAFFKDIYGLFPFEIGTTPITDLLIDLSAEQEK